MMEVDEKWNWRKNMISVIVPVYNVEKYLCRCIDSILNQKKVELELILIDDGSSDQSGKICDSYQQYPNVIVYHQANQGISCARNQGIDLSSGEYLLFVDSDDWLAENALAELLENGNDADLVLFGSYRAKEKGESYDISKGIYWKNQVKPFAIKDPYIEVLGKSVTLWNKLIKRTVIGDIRFSQAMTYGEDADFLCRIMKNVATAIVVPQTYYYYFVNRSGSVVAGSVNLKSLEFIENTKQFYRCLSELGYDGVAMKRISIVASEVYGKIPLSFAGILRSKEYIQAVKELLRMPSFTKRVSFLFDSTIELGTRLLYFRMLLNPFHIYFRLLRSRLQKEVTTK